MISKLNAHKKSSIYTKKHSTPKLNSSSIQKTRSRIQQIINTSEDLKVIDEISHLPKDSQKIFSNSLKKYKFDSEVYIPKSLKFAKAKCDNNKFFLHDLITYETKMQKNKKIIFNFAKQTDSISHTYKIIKDLNNKGAKKNNNNLKEDIEIKNKDKTDRIDDEINKQFNLFTPSILLNPHSRTECIKYNHKYFYDNYINDNELLSNWEENYLQSKNLNLINCKLLQKNNKTTTNFHNLKNLNNDKKNNSNNINFRSKIKSNKGKSSSFSKKNKYFGKNKDILTDINLTKMSLKLMETPEKNICNKQLITPYTDKFSTPHIKSFSNLNPKSDSIFFIKNRVNNNINNSKNNINNNINTNNKNIKSNGNNKNNKNNKNDKNSNNNNSNEDNIESFSSKVLSIPKKRKISSANLKKNYNLSQTPTPINKGKLLQNNLISNLNSSAILQINKNDQEKLKQLISRGLSKKTICFFMKKNAKHHTTAYNPNIKYRFLNYKSDELNKLYDFVKKNDNHKNNFENSDYICDQIKKYFAFYNNKTFENFNLNKGSNINGLVEEFQAKVKNCNMKNIISNNKYIKQTLQRVNKGAFLNYTKKRLDSSIEKNMKNINSKIKDLHYNYAEELLKEKNVYESDAECG